MALSALLGSPVIGSTFFRFLKVACEIALSASLGLPVIGSTFFWLLKVASGIALSALLGLPVIGSTLFPRLYFLDASSFSPLCFRFGMITSLKIQKYAILSEFSRMFPLFCC